MKPLLPTFDLVTYQIATDLLPGGWRALETGSPNTLEEVIDAFEHNHSTAIITAAIPKTTVFGDQEHLHAFRAWHDWVHWKLGQCGSFTLPGELNVAKVQALQIFERWGMSHDTVAATALTMIQVYEQNVYFFDTHETRVEDERRFALDHYHAWEEWSDHFLAQLIDAAQYEGVSWSHAMNVNIPVPKSCGRLDTRKGYRI